MEVLSIGEVEKAKSKRSHPFIVRDQPFYSLIPTGKLGKKGLIFGPFVDENQKHHQNRIQNKIFLTLTMQIFFQIRLT